jgi:hypothetical protein
MKREQGFLLDREVKEIQPSSHWRRPTMQTQHSHQSSKEITKMHQLAVPYLILENGRTERYVVKVHLFRLMGIDMKGIGKMNCQKDMDLSNGMMGVFV